MSTCRCLGIDGRAECADAPSEGSDMCFMCLENDCMGRGRAELASALMSLPDDLSAERGKYLMDNVGNPKPLRIGL